jgi:hypothetical protein
MAIMNLILTYTKTIIGAVVVVIAWYIFVVGYITIYAINAYHHQSCEFESRSGEVYSIQHYVMKCVSDLQQVDGFIRVLRFPPPRKLTATI